MAGLDHPPPLRERPQRRRSAAPRSAISSSTRTWPGPDLTVSSVRSPRRRSRTSTPSVADRQVALLDRVGRVPLEVRRRALDEVLALDLDAVLGQAARGSRRRRRRTAPGAPGRPARGGRASRRRGPARARGRAQLRPRVRGHDGEAQPRRALGHGRRPHRLRRRRPARAPPRRCRAACARVADHERDDVRARARHVEALARELLAQRARRCPAAAGRAAAAPRAARAPPAPPPRPRAGGPVEAASGPRGVDEVAGHQRVAAGVAAVGAERGAERAARRRRPRPRGPPAATAPRPSGPSAPSACASSTITRTSWRRGEARRSPRAAPRRRRAGRRRW